MFVVRLVLLSIAMTYLLFFAIAFAKVVKFPILTITFGNFLQLKLTFVMKGADLKEFRVVNNLTQTELGDYLGVLKGFISKIENDKEKLPEPKLRKLLNNEKGWDVSMLTNSVSDAGLKPVKEDALIAELRSQIEKLEAKVDNLNQELGEKNALIKLMRQGSVESV